MEFQVDVWLRGTDFATTEVVKGVRREPAAWTEEDVRLVLEGMLRAMDRQKHREGDPRPVSLRGLSWIVNPFDEGGVVIAVEITLGAAIAGPFAIEQQQLSAMISRVVHSPAGSPGLQSDLIH